LIDADSDVPETEWSEPECCGADGNGSSTGEEVFNDSNPLEGSSDNTQGPPPSPVCMANNPELQVPVLSSEPAQLEVAKGPNSHALPSTQHYQSNVDPELLIPTLQGCPNPQMESS